MADPTPPTGPAVSLSDLPRKSTGLTSMPQELLDAVAAAAAARGAPPPETPAAPVEAPAPKEAPKPAPVAPKAPEPVPAPIAAKLEPPKEAPKEAKGIKEVREALDRAQAKWEEANNSLTATTKEKADALIKLAEIEGKYNEATKAIQERYEPSLKELEATRKRLQEKEERLRIRDYTATDEWHEKYIKPIAETQAEVGELLTELRVQSADGNEIQATTDHFNYVLTAPSANEAARRAKELFGHDLIASQVVNYRARLVSLQRKQQEALKNAQLESAEWEKNQRLAMSQNQENFRNRILNAAKTLAEKEPEIFKPTEDDAESLNALVEGQKLTDLLLNGAQDLTPEQITDKIAEGRVRIQKSFVQEKRIAKLAKQVAELQEQLKAYQGSEPGVQTRSEPTAALGATSDAKALMLKAAQDLASRR